MQAPRHREPQQDGGREHLHGPCARMTAARMRSCIVTSVEVVIIMDVTYMKAQGSRL